MFTDAQHRIYAGQIPHIDFSSPIGPLSLYGYWLVRAIFTEAQPILAAQYSAVPIAAALLAWTIATSDAPKQPAALLWLFFCALAVSPANFDILPRFVEGGGTDASGIYNRQAGLVLFVLLTCLWWPGRNRGRPLILGALLTSLFFIKITAFAAGIALAVVASLTGQLSWRALAYATAGVIGASLIAFPITTAYLQDIIEMSRADGQSPRLTLGRIFRILEVTVSFCFFLLTIAFALVSRALGSDNKWSAFVRLVVPFVAALALGVLVESQNSGSQMLAFLVPTALRLGSGDEHPDAAIRARYLLLLGTIGFCVVVGAHLLQNYARLITSFARQHIVVELQDWGMHLRALPDAIDGARSQLEFGARHPQFQKLAAQSKLTNEVYLPLIQLTNLLSVTRAAEAVRELQRTGTSINTVATLDFSDPMPGLLGTQPIRGVPIVFDPNRTATEIQFSRTLEALSTADAIIAPHCPVLAVRELLLARAAPVLGQRKRIDLPPCWTIYLRQPN